MIKVFSFLTSSEAETVQIALKAQGIPFFLSSKGSVPGQYHDAYYQVSVHAKNYFQAKRIVARIMAKSFVENQKCPKCKVLSYRTIKDRTWWERIYYLGTTRVQCKRCKGTYVI